jgi:hypothetical protein
MGSSLPDGAKRVAYVEMIGRGLREAQASIRALRAKYPHLRLAGGREARQCVGTEEQTRGKKGRADL